MATIIGQPVNRVDGPLKVSGRATYAAEHWDAGQPLYGFIVGATIGKGRITAIDTAQAERSPGVRMVMTHRNAPAQGKADPSIRSAYSRAFPVLDGPDVHHYGEPVALVVADTYEQARAAAGLVEVTYAAEAGQFDFAARLDQAYAPKAVNAGLPTDSAVGDFDAAFGGAEVKIDATYTTPYQQSQPMEPHACLAVPQRRGPDGLRQLADRRRGAHGHRQHAADEGGAESGSSRRSSAADSAPSWASTPRRSWRRSPPVSCRSRSRW